MVVRQINFYFYPKFKVLLKIISSLTFLFLWELSFNKAVSSQTIQLGVVKTEENTVQWEEITNRLGGMNIDYCTIEFSRLSQQLPQSKLNTVFFPNVKTWTSLEVRTLEEWVNQGNRVIVSGETGIRSTLDLKNRLRSLLGAYWGFSLTTNTNLTPVTVQQQDWLNNLPPSVPIRGGAVIPFGLNSHTAAVWNTSGSLPAIVMGDRSVFIGWEWGQDQVSSAVVDQFWLKGILASYGSLPSAQNATGRLCGGEINPRGQTSRANLSNIPQQREEPLNQSSETSINTPPTTRENPQIAGIPPEENNTPSRIPREGITNEQTSSPAQDFYWRRQLLVKGEELKGLINRFESTFLTAQAYENRGNREITLEDKSISLNTNAPSVFSHNVIEEAKTELNFVLDLIAQNRYEEAEIKLFTIQNKLLENYPSDRYLAQPEIRYVWLDRGTIVKAKSEKDLIPLFDQFAQSGINIVFIETLNAGYTIYPSKIAPEQNPLIQGWDPLASAVKLAHERGMELHPWVWIFATANQRHNQILNQPSNYLGPILSRYPDWIITDNKGNLFQPSSQKAFLDPANPEVRAYLLSILEEIVTNYNVDGIQLDYIRYPFQNLYGNDTHGYGVSSRQQFFQLTGVDPITLNFNHSLWEKWTEFRIQQIDSFVITASQKLKAKRPNLILSTAVFPMAYYERIDKIQQNWESWIKEGYIDLLLPMTYAETTAELQNLTNPLFRHNPQGSALILPGLRLQNQSEMIVLDQVQYVRGLPTVGYGLFAAEGFNSDVYEVFRRTQGNNSSNDNPRNILPHRQPFLAIMQRYQRLQQEWNFWLDHGGLNMDETNLKQWKEGQNNLTRRLETLINEPTHRNFLLTQVELSLFKGNFQRWMKDYQKVNMYQVLVWNNRLLALEELLNYGERITF
jgi:uncharacterized lipoprotein YddW (UPF0748 family)